MNVINTIIKSKWGLGRWIRLGIGSAFLVDAYYKNSGMVALMGAFLLYQALFNTGCGMANSSCDTKVKSDKAPDISHNFIKLNYKK